MVAGADQDCLCPACLSEAIAKLSLNKDETLAVSYRYIGAVAVLYLGLDVNFLPLSKEDSILPTLHVLATVQRGDALGAIPLPTFSDRIWESLTSLIPIGLHENEIRGVHRFHAELDELIRRKRNKPRSQKCGVEIVGEDAVKFVRKLKNQEGKDIFVMGGGLLAKPLFEAKLIDEVGVNIHPVLLGSGILLFHEVSHQIDLELIECRAFKNGCASITYRVKS